MEVAEHEDPSVLLSELGDTLPQPANTFVADVRFGLEVGRKEFVAPVGEEQVPTLA